MNSCFQQIERSVQDKFGQTTDESSIIREDTSLEPELATAGGKVDEVDSRTAIVEANQFSTTTILNGNATFSITSVNGDLNID